MECPTEDGRRGLRQVGGQPDANYGCEVAGLVMGVAVRNGVA